MMDVVDCVCGAKARKIKTRLELYDGDVVIKDVDALYCPECDMELMTSEQVVDAQGRLREIIPGFEAFTVRKKIAQLGNSLTIPLAKEIADYVNAEKGGDVKITVKNKHRLIVDIG